MKTYQHISQKEAYEYMHSGEPYILVDVRTPDEFNGGHIPGAINIPNETILLFPPKQLPDKSATILVYCQSGRRSAYARQKLADRGYTDIREFGGIMTWVYETE